MCKYNPSTLVIYKQYIKFRIEKIWTQPQMKTFQPCISHANRWSTFTYMCKVGVIVHPARIVRGSGPYQKISHIVLMSLSRSYMKQSFCPHNTPCGHLVIIASRKWVVKFLSPCWHTF